MNIECKNSGCKLRIYDEDNDIHYCSCDTIEIDEEGKCESFEKGVFYYVKLVLNRIYNTNMILGSFLTDDFRIGMYIIMNMYHIGFSQMDYNGETIIFLKKGEDGKSLTGKEIYEMEYSIDDYNLMWYELDNGDIHKQLLEGKQKMNNIINGKDYDDEELSEEEKSHEEYLKSIAGKYGWLSPQGKFTLSPWGEHYNSASNIIEEENLTNEYNKWRDEKISEGSEYMPNDYLVFEKNYVLLHSPSTAGIIVTRCDSKNLTKAQKEFLYDYFRKLGDIARAESYLNE